MNRRDAEAADQIQSRKLGTDPSAPPTPAALHAAGLAHLHAGRQLDAQLCCEQALAIDPGHADSLQLLGLIALQAQQYDHAVEWLSRAILIDPRPESLSALGFTLKQAGRLDEAFAVFDKAVQLRPDDTELWKQLGGALAALDRRDEALAAYQVVLKLDPRHFEAAHASALLLQQMERFEDALVYFNLCVEWLPDNVPTLLSRARVLRALERTEECLADYRRLHALAPDDGTICNNIGNALLALDRHEEGFAWFDRALLLAPDHVEVLHNKGIGLYRLHRLGEAIEVYAHASARHPNDGRSLWQLAHLHLQTGDYARGWAEREARWMTADFAPGYPKLPPDKKWLGKEDVRGKTVLICSDEGFGDTLQFARYVPLLAARGASTVLMVQPALCPLLAGLPGVISCIPYGTTDLPPFDLHCPIMSLPLAFGTTLDSIPSASYLPPLPKARVQTWADRLHPHDQLRVGLVWSGNPRQGNDRNRSMPLATLAPLLDCDATFVSLQKDVRPDDRAYLSTRHEIIDLTAAVTDFVETAALIENLDLVITVCTSVAHLAGTLGRPTWVMLPYVGDWRWLTDRSDSPWYPAVRLFRQDGTRDYAGTVEQVRRELQPLISGFKA
jgi:tetratricopeptide (TPR) repeat protein